jgi:hypothetical protein
MSGIRDRYSGIKKTDYPVDLPARPERKPGAVKKE